MNGVPEGFLAGAIAELNGTARQKRVALAFVVEGNMKRAAQRADVTFATAKADMDRIYAANGVNCLVHLVVVAFSRVAAAWRRSVSAALPEDVGREPRDESAVAER